MPRLELPTPSGIVTIHTDQNATTLGKTGLLVRSAAVHIEHPVGNAHFYRNGWNSWSPTGWRRLDEEPLRIYDNPERLLTADDAATDDADRHVGSAVGALQLDDGQILLLGALSIASPAVGADSRALRGTSDDDETEWFVGVGPELEVFRTYADLVADRLGRRELRAGRVWSSWYSFFEDIDQERLFSVIDDLHGYPFDVVQVDDGWERVVGDWTPHDGFPQGLDGLAAHIRTAGFTPGLWVAPLIALPESQTVRDHPDWLVQDGDGGPLVAGYNWGSHYYALDTTVPAVQQYLRELFEGLVRDGFRYFKLDFMYAGALPGVRSKDVHRETAYREAIALIRSAVGEDVYLLGSGVPMLSSVGIFDGARVGPDVAPYWDNTERKRDPSGPGALNSLANSAARLWMAPWYEPDPDVVFFRTRRSLLDERAMQLLIDVAHITGFKAVSDPIAWLSDDERVQLRHFLDSEPEVQQLGRYRYRIDGRLVDFGEYIGVARGDLESMLVK